MFSAHYSSANVEIEIRWKEKEVRDGWMTEYEREEAGGRKWNVGQRKWVAERPASEQGKMFCMHKYRGVRKWLLRFFFFWQEMLKTRKRTERREVESDYYGVAENRNGSDLPAGRSWCWGSCLAPWEVVKPFRGYCSTRRTLRNSPSARAERSTGQVCKTRDPSTVICTRAVGALRSLQRQLVS